MAPRKGPRRRRRRGAQNKDNFSVSWSSTLSSASETKITAALFKWPANFTFVIDAITISVKSISKPMLVQWEAFNESGYLAKVFPVYMVSNTAGVVTRTFRWPKGVEHVNGEVSATNVFGMLRFPLINDVSTALVLVRIHSRLSGNILSIFGTPHTSGDDATPEPFEVIHSQSTSMETVTVRREIIPDKEVKTHSG